MISINLNFKKIIERHYIMKENNIKPMPLWESIILFLIPTIYFFFITSFLMSIFGNSVTDNPILSWIIGGLIMFVPLFILSLILFKFEGNKFYLKILFERFRINKIKTKDWLWILFSIISVFIISFIIVSISKILSNVIGIRELKMIPDFIKINPNSNVTYLTLLLWLPMFFLNIVGEELLWRGYMLPRMEINFKKYSWLINAILWTLFHAPFGIDLIILLLPTLFIIPFTVYKTKNTSVGIIIHAILNGPMFVFINLGLIR